MTTFGSLEHESSRRSSNQVKGRGDLQALQARLAPGTNLGQSQSSAGDFRDQAKNSHTLGAGTAFLESSGPMNGLASIQRTSALRTFEKDT